MTNQQGWGCSKFSKKPRRSHIIVNSCCSATPGDFNECWDRRLDCLKLSFEVLELRRQRPTQVIGRQVMCEGIEGETGFFRELTTHFLSFGDNGKMWKRCEMMRVSEIPANCDVLVSGLQCLQVQRQEFDWLEVFEGSVCCISGFVELPLSCDLTSGFVFGLTSDHGQVVKLGL